MNLLILYPKLFNVEKKFNRKLSRIIANKTLSRVLYMHDDNLLIHKYFAGNSVQSDFFQTNDVQSCEDVSHAIVFDDGEELANQIQWLSDRKIPLRIIKVKITRVVNISKEIKYKSVENCSGYEYIGRGSYWGNPHSMFEEGDDRDEVIRKYKYDFDYEKFPHIDKAKVFELAGKKLGCFCKPLACHGDVLANFLNSWDDGK